MGHVGHPLTCTAMQHGAFENEVRDANFVPPAGNMDQRGVGMFWGMAHSHPWVGELIGLAPPQTKLFIIETHFTPQYQISHHMPQNYSQ